MVLLNAVLEMDLLCGEGKGVPNWAVEELCAGIMLASITGGPLNGLLKELLPDAAAAAMTMLLVLKGLLNLPKGC